MIEDKDKTMKTSDKLIIDLIKDALKDPQIKRQIVKELLNEIDSTKSQSSNIKSSCAIDIPYSACGSSENGCGYSGCR